MFNQCKNCNYQNEADALFCNQCGVQLDSTIQCHNCQTQNAADAQFCTRCGQAFTANASNANPVAQPQPVSEAVSGSTPGPLADSGVPSAGWQPGPAVQPTRSESLSSPGETTSQSPAMTQAATRGRFIGRRGKNTTAGRSSAALEGEVRGFKERMERNNQQATPSSDETIWTFRLERYQDGRQLLPIPVEMRGHRFTGFINEGDTVRLLDKWRGEGLHRTKRVYNVTNSIRVEAKKKGLSIWLKLWIVIFFFGIPAAFIIIASNG